MDLTAPTAHAGHDELLIARLFGGDVDQTERAQAVDLMAGCPECAALFADLGALVDANAAMPIPPRPRDFTLTAADAARLRRKPHFWSPIFGAGLRRSLGSSLAALGLAGALLTGVASVLGGSATSAPIELTADQNAQAPVAAAAASPASGATTAGGEPRPGAIGAGPSGSTAAPALGPAASPVPAASGREAGNPGAPPPAESSASTDMQLNAASPIAFAGGENGTSGTKSATTNGAVSQSGMDARLLWLGGFVALFGIGLAIALLPRLPRRRGRGTRS
jgi:anti-sigma factor RsiW